MRAVVLRAFGPPSVLRLEEVAEPDGEALVEVAFASVTFVETMVRAGRAPHSSMAPALPAILGNGVAGTVDGAPVVTTTGGLGGYAERAAVPRAGLIEVPEGLGLDAAAALLADGRTAVGLIAAARIAPGETVLVEAAGGVGSLPPPTPPSRRGRRPGRRSWSPRCRTRGPRPRRRGAGASRPRAARRPA